MITLRKPGRFFDKSEKRNRRKPAGLHFFDEEYAALKKAFAEGDKPHIKYPLFDVLFCLMELAP